jgi:hypothetical protein
MVMPPDSVFGFHGLMHLPIVYAKNLPYLIQHLPLRVIKYKMSVLSSRIGELDMDTQKVFWEHYKLRLETTK